MSTSTPSSSSSSSPCMSLVLPEVLSVAEKCRVCGKPAFCYNYGVLTCNACKMFFRRVKVEKITYTCKFWNNCFDKTDRNENLLAIRCKACRFHRCLEAGMVYLQPGKPIFELKNRKDDEFQVLINDLLFMDSRRRHKWLHFYTDEDPTLREMIERSRGSRMVLKTPQHSVQITEWSFFGVYTSVEFFMGLEFMNSISNDDKEVLLHHFCMKAMLFSSAMRVAVDKRDVLVTPDGQDVYPDYLYQLAKFSMTFLHRIRSQLPARLLSLGVTSEEHVLLLCVLFCNPVHSKLSHHGRDIIGAQQKVYSSALLRYCMLKYQSTGPSRFADLLSLCHALNKNHEDVHNLMMLFQFYMPHITYKKLFVDVQPRHHPPKIEICDVDE